MTSKGAQMLGITTKQSTIKHAQTIKRPERTHANIKASLYMSSCEYRMQWDKNNQMQC